MSSNRYPSILHYLRQVLADPAAAGVSDAELLRRFVDQRDEAAFELLLWRHAAMVLHVCRQVLSDEQAAEDAFQATFLVLARKCNSISRREALGSWLYRVAYHIALKAQAEMRKRTSIERELSDRELSVPADSMEAREQHRIVAEEVHHLPAKFRAAIVSCYFESKTLEEAAQQLGWPRGTVASRLARGREMLRRRLIRRGVALTAATLMSDLSVQTSAAALTQLIPVTLRTIKLFTASSAIKPSIAALAEGVVRAMYWTRVKIAMIVVLLIGLGGVGTFWAAAPRQANSPQESAPPDNASRGEKAEASNKEVNLLRNMVQSRLNLRKLAWACITHADANKGFLPPPALINKEGKAVLSWRVLILPYLGERELYEQFKLSEPWDGPINRKLLSKMPREFAPPGIETPEPFSTFYQVFVSPKPKDGRKGAEVGGRLGVEIQAGFVDRQPQLFPAHFPDGVSNTILIVEAGKAVPWTKPEDLPYEADKPLPELGGMFPDVFQAAFADGEVHVLRKRYNEFNLRRWITSNGGEIVDSDEVEARSAAAEQRRWNRILQQWLDDERERQSLLQEERDALQGQAGGAKRPKEDGSRLDELKKENLRLQKEYEKIKEEIRSLNAEILQLLQKSSKK